MLPKHHILLGALFSFTIFLIFPEIKFYTFVIFLSSFLIDFDHYLVYVFRKKDFNLKKANKYFLTIDKQLVESYKNQKIPVGLFGIFRGRNSSLPKRSGFQEFLYKKNTKAPLMIFHTLEFLIFLLIISYFNKLIFFILLGILIHQFLDAIDIYSRFKTLNPRIWSLTWLMFNRKRKDIEFL
ncbi:MAG: hypothetical protein ABIG37_01670 [Nanoarchaeota archaeon]|nr:hypothetical protein [Nanoarchaeota archaeon]